jgi:hypothetical protein
MENADKLIAWYINARDQIDAEKAAFQKRMEPLVSGMARVEALFLDEFKKSGAQNLAARTGTAYKTTKKSVTVEDRQAFLDWLQSTDKWDMVTLQANKPAVVAYREEHDSLPIGVKWSEHLAVTFNRPKTVRK